MSRRSERYIFLGLLAILTVLFIAALVKAPIHDKDDKQLDVLQKQLARSVSMTAKQDSELSRLQTDVESLRRKLVETPTFFSPPEWIMGQRPFPLGSTVRGYSSLDALTRSIPNRFHLLRGQPGAIESVITAEASDWIIRNWVDRVLTIRMSKVQVGKPSLEDDGRWGFSIVTRVALDPGETGGIKFLNIGGYYYTSDKDILTDAYRHALQLDHVDAYVFVHAIIRQGSTMLCSVRFLSVAPSKAIAMPDDPIGNNLKDMFTTLPSDLITTREEDHTGERRLAEWLRNQHKGKPISAAVFVADYSSDNTFALRYIGPENPGLYNRVTLIIRASSPSTVELLHAARDRAISFNVKGEIKNFTSSTRGELRIHLSDDFELVPMN